jgi:hypothetical protein
VTDNVGAKRLVVVTVLATAFVIILDHYGVINRIANMIG